MKSESSLRSAASLVGRVSLLLVVSCGSAGLAGSSSSNDTSPDAAERRTFPALRGWVWLLSPGTDLFPRYVADPRRATFSMAALGFRESEIEESGKSRWGLRLGGRYGFLRLHRRGDPSSGFQMDVEAGFLGQFDREQATDNLGWDGLYGIQLAWAGRGGTALRLGWFHDSSHVGDEYAERTGRRRVNYTRQEWLLGWSRGLARSWRCYAEAAYATDLRNEEIMEPWRFQLGLEFESRRRFWGDRLAAYAALDLSAFEENDYRRNATLQAGVLLPVEDLARSYRVGFEFYEGRSQIGEFFRQRERYLALGLWFDL